MKKLIFLFIFTLGFFNIYSQACDQYGPNYYGCGIPTYEIEYMRANSVNGGRQIQSNWCWAACIQMVLNYYGLYVNQVDIVTRIFGSPYANQPATQEQILAALNGWQLNNRGGYSYVYAEASYTTVDDIVNLLSNKMPLIVGLVMPGNNIGHAYVLTAIYYSYSYDYYGNITGIIPDKVVLRDPWPTNPSRQEMSWYEFTQRCFMVIKVWVMN